MKKRSTWNTAPRAKKKGARTDISRDQLSSAVQKFRQRGGLIHTLPPEQSYRRHTVGANVDTGIESLFDS